MSYVPKEHLPLDFVRFCDGFLHELMKKYPSEFPIDWKVSPDVEIEIGPGMLVNTLLLPTSFIKLWSVDRESMELVLKNIFAHEYAHYLIRLKSIEPKAVHTLVPPLIPRSVSAPVSQFYADRLALVWSGVPKRLALTRLRRLMTSVFPTAAEALKYSEEWRKASVPL